MLGLPRRLAIDPDALQRRFYELSRRYHPDFHQGAEAEAQARVLEASASVNAAYRTLRDPVARVEYLLRLETGQGPGGPGSRTPAPPALLAEMFEIQEALAEARAGGLDGDGRAALAAQRARLRARLEGETARVTGPLSREWDSAEPADRPRLLEAFREALATRAYLRTVIDDLDGALGEDRDGHVANHRH